eukprot:5663368-Prymnesium_polylepis.1
MTSSASCLARAAFRTICQRFLTSEASASPARKLQRRLASRVLYVVSSKHVLGATSSATAVFFFFTTTLVCDLGVQIVRRVERRHLDPQRLAALAQHPLVLHGVHPFFSSGRFPKTQ